MGTLWLWVTATCALAGACADHGAAGGTGGSLRGALEALQRRQRGRLHQPSALPDYDALYDILGPQVPEQDYEVEMEDLSDEPNPKYVLKLLEEKQRSPDNYEYKIITKKNTHSNIGNSVTKQESAFRERSRHSDNDRLRELFTDQHEADNKKEETEARAENDAEYALLLGQLWTKYKNHHRSNYADAAPGVVRMYKERSIKKRMPDNWGPVAFKRKRSPDANSDDTSLEDYISDSSLRNADDKTISDTKYSVYDVPDDNKSDMQEEYTIAFQPLDDDGMSDVSDQDQYSYDLIEKRFPVTKRSSGSFDFGKNKKRYAHDDNKHEMAKRFRSSSGTDPRIIEDLSKIFGNPNIMKSPVKRSSTSEESSHETKPPQVTIATHNSTHEHNASLIHIDESHELHSHIHHPGVSGKETEVPHEHNDDIPISVRKKSIDWSNYFGIDKRKKKLVSFANDQSQGRLRKHYFDTFNKEVIFPLNSFRQSSKVKKNTIDPKPSEETVFEMDTARAIAIQDPDKRSASDSGSKLDVIDKKLKNMEGFIVDEALHYSDVGDELDSKEEQQMKEKMLTRLAAAYSLEKMRKALKEFKQSLQIQKNEPSLQSSPDMGDEAKAKRISIKKEKADINDNEMSTMTNAKDLDSDDFESEQGAGHYLNGKIEQQYSEGYMGSGRHRTPAISTAGGSGSCPVLERIVQRCRGVDLLAGDRGQLFLPLCSLHQICYLCGEAPPTTCDLVFLSEADTACEGDTACQRAARSALMALRELHDALADELDGECEASPCLPEALRVNAGWWRALQR